MNLTRRGFNQLLGATLAYSCFGAQYAMASLSTVRYSSAPALKIPIQEIYPTIFNKEIYVTGGFVPSNTPTFYGLGPTNQVQVFSPDKQIWRIDSELPQARHHLGLLSNSKYLYGIGGLAGDSSNAWQVQNNTYRKTALDSEWQIGPSLPEPKAESVYASNGENLHVIGGVTQNKVSQKKSYSEKHFVLVDDEHWEEAAPASISRSSATAVLLNNRIYVFGGRRFKPADNLTYAEVYDIKTDRWQPIKPLPVGVAGAAAAVFKGKILITGGESFTASGDWKAGKAHRNSWLYDTEKDSWAALPELPQSRHGHGAVNYKGSVYLIGGALKVGPQETTASMLKISDTKNS